MDMEKLNTYLETDIPDKTRVLFKTVTLLIAVIYLLVATLLKYWVTSSPNLNGVNGEVTFLSSFIGSFWWLYIVSAFSCLGIWHYVKNTVNIKRSITSGVTILMFSQILLMFYFPFALLLQATGNS